MNAVVDVNQLVKRYGNFTAVNGISFRIGKGELFSFLGPNGAGKTSVMRIITCFLPPTGGEVHVLGMNVTAHPDRIKERIGVTPQEDSLDPDLSVIENLVVYANYFGIRKKEATNKAEELLAMMELTEKKHAPVMALSGGMKRRLVIARSLINSPDLLVLDEPTTGLDPHSRRLVWERVKSLKEKGTTVFLTTHYMEEAQNLADRVAIMDAGRIIEIDTPAALMERHGGNLEEVYLKLTGKNLEP